MSNTFPNSLFLIDELHLLGRGTQKNVYQHPEDPAKIIKVMRQDRGHADGGLVNQNVLRRRFTLGIYKQFMRELLQYFKLCKSHYQANTYIFPIETPLCFVHTDQGLGLVTEKIISPSGKPATLLDLCKNGEFEDKHVQALRTFFDQCCELHIVFGEVNAAGILYTESRSGKPEFVLVDGIGEKLLIPIRAMSKTINANQVRKVERKIKAKLGITY